MVKLDENIMKNTYAGSLSAGAIAGICAGIAAGISFIVGIFDGYTRPYKCR